MVSDPVVNDESGPTLTTPIVEGPLSDRVKRKGRTTVMPSHMKRAICHCVFAFIGFDALAYGICFVFAFLLKSNAHQYDPDSSYQGGWKCVDNCTDPLSGQHGYDLQFYIDTVYIGANALSFFGSASLLVASRRMSDLIHLKLVFWLSLTDTVYSLKAIGSGVLSLTNAWNDMNNNPDLCQAIAFFGSWVSFASMNCE
jgi:hypothetical protein